MSNRLRELTGDVMLIFYGAFFLTCFSLFLAMGCAYFPCDTDLLWWIYIIIIAVAGSFVSLGIDRFLNDAKKKLSWNTFIELSGDLIVVADSIFMIWWFGLILLKGGGAAYENYLYILIPEMVVYLLILLLGTNRLYYDIKAREKSE